MTPVDQMLAAVEWKELPPQPPGDRSHATHAGVLKIGNSFLRCYRLSDGQRVFDADDVERFFAVGPEKGAK